MLRKKLVPIVMSVFITAAGCGEIKSLYQGAEKVYQKAEKVYKKVKSTGDEYGISVNRKRVELTVPEKFIPIPDKLNPELKVRVEFNNVGYDPREARFREISARLDFSF